MRFFHGVLLAAVLLPACASAGGTGPIPGDGWTPPPGALDLAARLGSADESERAAAEEALAALDDEARVSVLRAGLRLPDGPAAVACAGRLDWTWIDTGEAARAVALLTPVLFTPGCEADFEEFRSYIGSDELGPLLETVGPGPFGTPGRDSMVGSLSALHRVVRAEHLPLLCRLAVHPDEDVRDGAWDCFQTTLPNTDRHREEVARMLLAFWQDRLLEGPEIPPSEGPGYPPLLRAVLKECFLEREGVRTVDQWAARWMNDETPGPADAPLLLAMEETGLLPVPAELSLRLAVGSLSDPETGAVLRSWLEEKEEDAHPLLFAAALDAAVARGLPGAEERLRATAEEGAEALVFLARREPAAAAAILRGHLFDADPEVRAWGRRFANGALVQGELLDRPLADGIFDGMEEEALAADLDGASLASLGVLHPAFATERIARAAVAALGKDPPAPGEDSSDLGPLDDRESAFLDAAAPGPFRALLREWSSTERTGENSWNRDWALRCLLVLGDPERGADLLAFAREGEPTGPSGEEADFLLSRSPCPEVEEYLRGRASAEPWDAGALVDYAALHGFPGNSFSFAATYVDESLPDPARRAEFRRLVLEGRPVDALAEVLAGSPDYEGWDIGLVDDPRVRAHLAGLRDRRAPGKHRYAVEQLTLAGDPSARAELWGAYRCGRYRWVDEADERPMTLGWDLAATMPFWIEDLESACCRFYKPAWLLDRWFGIDAHGYAGDRDIVSLVVPATVLRRWWARCGSRLRRSPLSEEWVVGPPAER